MLFFGVILIEETFEKKHEDMEPPITVLLFSQVSSADYPTYSAESMLSFRTRIPLCEIAKLDQVHYKVYDDTGKCSIIFFDRHATELLGKSASKMKEDMQEEGRNSTIPKELDEIAGKLVIVKLKIKSHNIKHRTINQLTMNCQGYGENELPTAKSSLLNPLSNFRATNDQHGTSTPYVVVDNNLTCTFHSNYLDDGDASLECQFCGSQMWFAERLKGLKKNLVAQFDICCCKGKIIVPLLKRPPEELEQLFFIKDSSHAKKFLRNIHLYNMFSFTSMGGRIDHSINSKGGGPYSFVLSVSHVGGGHLDQSIVEMLKECLDKHNCVVKHYRNAAEIIKANVISDVTISLIRSSNVTGQSKQYNMPTTSELAALIVGDFDNSYTKRDIIVKRQSGSLQRIDELHMAYLPLQYPLLFPYGDNGYDSSNEHAQESLSTTKPREYMAFV
ncbi:hypothetical protein K1719_045411 [Acacia pycnantha]|nr:hypothetical protein K1719_045411 [Acacia pycnantha]